MDDFIITNTSPSVTLTIATTDITENWTKALIVVPYPKSEGQQDKVDPANNYQVKILDILGKMERRVTVSGHLSTGYGTGNTSTNATDKADELRKLFMKGGLVTITYYGAISGTLAGIDKMEIKKVANDVPDNTDGVVEFDINMSFIIGENMTGG
jgi:hypothetical protein